MAEEMLKKYSFSKRKITSGTKNHLTPFSSIPPWWYIAHSIDGQFFALHLLEFAHCMLGSGARLLLALFYIINPH